MEILNKYQYDPKKDLIGKGGFSTVYRAYDKILDIYVALKFFHAQDIKSKYNITNEIKRVIKLSHPNIIKFYGIETLSNQNIHGEQEDIQIGVMEIADEGQINIFLKQNNVSKEQLKGLLIGVLEGLKYLHNQGIIHRDIKPQNILIAKDNKNNLIPKIADFGISKTVDANQTSASMLLGTVEYMAPEQFNPVKYGSNGKISYNVDLWSFGVMTYYLLKNEFIFGGKTAETSPGEIINKIINLEKIAEKLSGIEEPFASVIKRCLEPQADKRPSDIDELIAILEETDWKRKDKKETEIKISNNHQTHDVIIDSDQTLVIQESKNSKNQEDSDETKIINNNDSDETKIIETEKHIETTNSIPDKTNTKEIKLNFQKYKKIGIAICAVIALGLIAFKFLIPNENEKYKDVLSKIESSLIAIPKGSFTMGNATSIPDCECGTEKVVKIENRLKILSTEITQGIWNAIMEDGRFIDTTKQKFPATNITWNDTQVFLKKLNTISKTTNPYRLPTEAEWEYACIGDSDFNTFKPFLEKYAWTINDTKGLAKVGLKRPNQYGIYDMLGNAYEWCDDWFDVNDKDKLKVLRGGDFKNAIELVDPYCRNRDYPVNSSETTGFRIVQNF